MPVFGLNPFAKPKKKSGVKASAKKTNGKSAYAKMKTLKKKAKTCEFC